jgi:hypothetical protein
MGMGLHRMPGDVWWRTWRTWQTWRTLPPKQCVTDPDFSGQGQWPVAGYWQTYTDSQSGERFNIWEGHYAYRGTSLTFVPTYAGGIVEGLMANLVVPETAWGQHSFGLDDLRWAQVQENYATQVLHYPVWGMSPSSTPDDTGNYGGFGVEGLKFPAGDGLAQMHHLRYRGHRYAARLGDRLAGPATGRVREYRGPAHSVPRHL